MSEALERLRALEVEATAIAEEHDALDETDAGNPYIANHVALARVFPALLDIADWILHREFDVDQDCRICGDHLDHYPECPIARLKQEHP